MATGRGRPPFSVRGVPGGWRDWWDDPDDHAELRARGQAIERQQTRLAEVLGVVWQCEIAEEHRLAERERPRQRCHA